MARRVTTIPDAEPVPEADRLDDYPHPRETVEFYGHGGAQAELAGAFASGLMHHAWLVTGPEGVGKATLAYRFARHALAAADERDGARTPLDVPADSIAARQVRALSHPGLLVIRRPYDLKAKRLRASIPVEEVRALRAFLGHTAGAGAWRVVIVDTVDELNVNGQNALLKSVEEPPARTVFLLLSSEPGRLLPTIRSRARGLSLAPLGAHDLRRAAGQALAAIDRPLPADADWPMLERLAKGSARRALSFASGEMLGLSKTVDGLLSALPKVDWAAANALAEQLGPAQAEQRFEMFHELLLDRIAALVRARTLDAADSGDRAASLRLIADGKLASWAELWETLAARKAEADALNLDRRTLVLNALAGLQRLSRLGRTSKSSFN